MLGFHKEFSTYFSTEGDISNDSSDETVSTHCKPTAPPLCSGQFTALRTKEDKYIVDRYQHIPAKAGR